MPLKPEHVQYDSCNTESPKHDHKHFYLEVHFHSLAEFQAFCSLVSGADLSPEQTEKLRTLIAQSTRSTTDLVHAEQADAGQHSPA